MSALTEIIQKRRSVRRFKDGTLDRATIVSIVQAAQRAPSACNAQPWRFVAVTDNTLIHALVEKGLGGVVSNKWAATAPAIIVGCAERNVLTHYLGEAVKGINYHQIDLGIALEHMVLRATEMGLSTCWIGWFNEKQIKKILNLPMGWKIVSLLALGYSQEEESLPTPRLDLDKILFFNRIA